MQVQVQVLIASGVGAAMASEYGRSVHGRHADPGKFLDRCPGASGMCFEPGSFVCPSAGSNGSQVPFHKWLLFHVLCWETLGWQ